MRNAAKRIAILGSTGSIGTQALEVISRYPERFAVEGLAAGRNTALLAEQIKRFSPKKVAVADKWAADELRTMISPSVQVYYGAAGLVEVAAGTNADFVIAALVGSLGLESALAAIRAGKHIGLANKETLVCAGHLVTEFAARHQVMLLPIDSEHSAIFQCLNGERRSCIRRIILTASGGAFRDKTREQLKHAKVADALRHPNWSMGAKVTIDSATMANKGLEVMEAHWLFSLPYEQIDVLMHPESIVHSLVEFADTSVVAQLGVPDMRLPIQYALSYPDRFPASVKRLDLAKLGALHFYEPDFKRYPCLHMAYICGKTGGTMPAVYNAANEVAVQRFLAGEISFLHIEAVIEKTLERHRAKPAPDLAEILAADHWARTVAAKV
ncbi:MAG TPA: 1-deoxy-D-xylulose-5-phosphate reductoisomerase [Bacilli bacterium]